ncbi:hypothetical protein AAC387_Pa02g3288 [Persea americana]
MAKPTFCNYVLLPESMFLRFTVNCGSLQLVFFGQNHCPSGYLFRSASSTISNMQASAAIFSSDLPPGFFSEPGAQYLAPPPLIFFVFFGNTWAKSPDRLL